MPIRYEVIPGRDLDERLIGAWDAVQRTHDVYASPYLSPWFARAVAGVRNDVYVTTLEDAGRPVGFFPHQRSGARGVPIAGTLNDCQAVVVNPAAEWSPSDLVRESGLRLWDFDHLLAAQEPFRAYARRHDVSPIIRLGDGFAAYEQDRKAAGSRRIEQLQRKWRKLEREHASVRFEACSRDVSALRRVIEWKLAQCERTGAPVFFREHWTVELVERLLAQDEPGCAGALSVVWIGDEVAAAHFGMRSRTLWHWWFPTYADAWSGYSPGALLLLKLCAHVASPETPQHTIDLGKGDDAYKPSFANDAVPLLEGHVSRGSAYAVARSAKRGAIAWAKHTPLLAPVRSARRTHRERRG